MNDFESPSKLELEIIKTQNSFIYWNEIFIEAGHKKDCYFEKLKHLRRLKNGRN
jgi:hypothetical protein